MIPQRLPVPALQQLSQLNFRHCGADPPVRGRPPGRPVPCRPPTPESVRRYAAA